MSDQSTTVAPHPLGVALACCSDFSLGEATYPIKQLVSDAKDKGYHTLALTDIMTISGMPDFMAASKKAGIKPIIGVTLRVYDDPLWRKPKKGETGPTANPMHTLRVFVRTHEGLQQLYRLLTLAETQDHFYYNSRVGFLEVLEYLKPGDVEVSTGVNQGLMSHPAYLQRTHALAAHFGTLWVDMVPVNTPLFDRLNERCVEVLGSVPGTKALAVYPVLYPQGADASADVSRAIATNTKMGERWLPVPWVRDYHLGNPVDLAVHMKVTLARATIPSSAWATAATNAIAFAKTDFYTFEKKAPCLPVMSADEYAEMVIQCKMGWHARFVRPVLGYQPTPEDLRDKYLPRLQYEVGVIKSMGFSGYFLLVQEIVKWSKNAGIIVGPGRGSVGGSLIAYLMGITDVDPIRFDLLFERFINPERLDLPDADLDFMSTRRHEVIEHIVATYGAPNVAGISNYTTLGPASAIRDVARMHGLEPLDYACSKRVEKEHGVSLSLEESVAKVPDIDKFAKKYPEVWAHSLALEGRMRGLGTHAAGVIVAGEPVVNRAVVSTRDGVTSIVNWDKRTVEDHGLIKMDILGLSTLDTLGVAAEFIKARHFKTINYMDLPLDDPKVLDAFGRGKTVGVFQFESAGMRKLLTDLAVGGQLTFDDLCAVTALFRPGPLDAGLTDEYIAVKRGDKSPYYENPNMRAALEPTFGITIYQEQVMQLSRDLSGFTLAEADHLRKAIGKKDKEKMETMGEKFINGAVTLSGMSEYAAKELWDKILGFAAYSFNKSHSYEYSIISYLAMWVKVYYPAEFYAASMTVVEDEDKLAALVLDARNAGIQTLPPDINASTDKVGIKTDTELVAPFQAIKGISTNSAAAIIKLRELAGGKIDSPVHLEALAAAHKMGSKCNKTHRERLDLVGAFHSVTGEGKPPLHPDRLRDRLELMPGFTVDSVKASRKIDRSPFILATLAKVWSETSACDKCSLKGTPHVLPRLGRSPKFVMVFDSPSWEEEKAGKLLEGDNGLYVKSALKDAGLDPSDGFYTSVVRAQKPKGSKGLTTEQVNGCTEYLKRELEALKPPVIVTMGTNAAKFFNPSMKGNPADFIGKVIYDPKLDASIIFGFNPSQLHYDPSKIVLLQKTMTILSDLV